MNNAWKCALFICGKIYVSWKHKMLHDDIFVDLWGIEFLQLGKTPYG